MLTIGVFSTWLIKGIKHYEGFSSKSYLCPSGILTIGYGSTSDVFKNQIITEEEAERRLINDLEIAKSGVIKHLRGAEKSSFHLEAMTSWVFNLGTENLRTSTLRKYYNKKDFPSAGEEILRWIYGRVGGKMQILPGLIKRRTWERNIFLFGNYDIQ